MRSLPLAISPYPIDAVIPKDWGHRRRRRPSGLFRHPDARVAGGALHHGPRIRRGRQRPAYALGVAAARRQGRDGKIVLFEGDGGLLFHIQELETLKRCGFRILICAMNDGGYGSEFHKLRADGIDDSLAVFGRPALLEHPDLRSGHGADYPGDHQARAWEYVMVSKKCRAG